MRQTVLIACILLMGCFAVAALAAPLRVCLLSGSEEYKSDVSLAAFKEYLEKHFDMECTLLKAVGFEELPGLEALEKCDVSLFFTRRLRTDGEDLERVKKYGQSGKPIVAVRTASHGFQNWLEFDKEILGGNYHNHFPEGPVQTAVPTAEAEKHPVMKGVRTIESEYSLYKTAPVASDVTVLMNASIPNEVPQPAVWVREYRGARVFYTSLGGPKDFENAQFRKLLANALCWAARQEVRELKRR